MEICTKSWDDSFPIFANKVEIADEEHGDAATPNKV